MLVELLASNCNKVLYELLNLMTLSYRAPTDVSVQPTTMSPERADRARSDLKSAVAMVKTARAKGQDLRYRSITPGDGSCFYHAIIDQVRNRPEVSRLLRQNTDVTSAIVDHLSLRKAVVKFTDERERELGAFIDFLYDDEEISFKTLIERQNTPPTFARDVFLDSTAMLLGVDIWMISRENSVEHPYTKISCGRPSADARIVLGYIPDIHFQSLYPVTQDAAVEDISVPGEPSAKKSRPSDADRKRLERMLETSVQREQRLADKVRRTSQARQTETSAQREQRLADKVRRTSQARQTETSAQREQRLAGEAHRTSQARQTETSAQREQRLADKVSRTSQARQKETGAERRDRLGKTARAMSHLRESRRSQASTSSVTVDADDAAQVTRPQFWDQGVKFHKALEARKFHICEKCNELDFIEATVEVGRLYKCKRCTKDPITFSKRNGMDPGAVPEALNGLTQVEQLLIAQIIPMMTIVRLSSGGQFGYRGNVINLPQDLPSLVTTLPRRVSDTDIIVIRKQLDENRHHDFKVRRGVVHRALLWLKVHNTHYKDIDISEDNLQSLPEDGFPDLPSIQLPDADDCPVADVTPPPAPANDVSCDDAASSVMPNTFVPLNIPRPTETAEVNASLRGVRLQWPTVSDRPVNEFDTFGYVSRCFPALFPTGNAELRTDKPREKVVTEPPYYKHLMRYKDQRFAQHPRFRYFAYNTLLRHRSLATGRMYIRQHPDAAALTLEDMRAMPEAERRRLAQDVLRFASHLRGSQQFWRSQRQCLMALIDQLGTPHCFFTLSSADMQWPDLQGYLRQFGGVQSPSAAVASNPLLCTWYMHERVTLFIESFLRDVLGLHTYWARHEYQHRGSLHTHGVGYLREGIDVTEFVRLADTYPERLAEYIDNMHTAWHPAPPVPGQPFVPPVRHPCARRFEDVEDFEADYESLINCVQRHTRCKERYCLRKKRGSAVAECRFGYPKPLVDPTAVSVDRSDGGHVKVTVEPRRNDPLLNCHNRAIAQTWRANSDFQVIIDRRRVVEYLAKYISKVEPVSQDLKDLLDVVLRTTDAVSERATTTVVQRLLIKAVCERDISAQEVSHHLMELPLVLCSRQFHILSVDGLQVERELVSEAAAGSRSSKCDLDKYVARDAERESLSMFQYFKKHYRSRNARRGEYDAVRRIDLIVRVIPRLVACPSDPERHIRFCQQQLMLHKPFRRVSQLTEGYADAVEAYTAMTRYQQSLDSGADIDAEVANYRDATEYDPVDEDGGADEELRQEDEWTLLCKHINSLNGQADDRDQMYEEYPEYDWTAAAASYDTATAGTFVGDQRQAAVAVGDVAHVSADSLVGNQCVAFDLVASHAERDDAEPIRAIFSGTAGTGKSHLIHAIRSRLDDRCKVVAPTGVAAFSVSGTTVHHLFHLPVQKMSFVEMSGASLRNLQDEHAGTSYYIFDEMSMIGCRMLGMIDERLRQAFPNFADQAFGGRSIILVGDFGQLPPVGDSPLWSDPRTSSIAIEKRGQSAFAMFTTAVVLDRVVRQAGDTAFRNALLRLRDAETTDADYRLFCRCFMANEGDDFQSAVHLYPTKNKVAEHNLRKLSELHCSTNPVAPIKAKHSPDIASARNADTDQAGGLRKVVYLARDARVMLTVNIWVEAGLVNGCVGTVVDIVYTCDKRPPDQLPDFVVCHFPQYRGPPYAGPNTVPITPVQRTWQHDNRTLSRINLPLTLAWAVTIHKSQGLTLDKAVVDVGHSERSAGLSFVAMSRVRSLDHLRLAPFAKDRLTKIAGNKNVQKRKQADARLLRMASRQHQ